MWALKHDKNLKVSPLIMESMIELKEIRMYQDKEVIMERGEPIKHFIISLEGGINNNPEL
jgi:CRP-like cAMP-binding protein